jgi:hypothetical protein
MRSDCVLLVPSSDSFFLLPPLLLCTATPSSSTSPPPSSNRRRRVPSSSSLAYPHVDIWRLALTSRLKKLVLLIGEMRKGVGERSVYWEIGVSGIGADHSVIDPEKVVAREETGVAVDHRLGPATKEGEGAEDGSPLVNVRIPACGVDDGLSLGTVPVDDGISRDA